MSADPGVEPDARPLSVSVLTVVVTAGITRYLPEALRAIAEQERAADRVVIVDVGEVTDAPALHAAANAAGLGAIDVIPAPGVRTLGAAVRTSLARLADRADGAAPDRARWLWILHDDAAPEPRALAELVRTGESGRSIAVVGSKQRDWVAPDELLEVGVTVSPGGRRYTGVEDGELDQGQHDGRDDVYAVGTAGMLIARRVWDDLGGPDPVLGPFGDGLDLCRRARLAGYRVVVAPGAVVRHARASYLGLRPSGKGRSERAHHPPTAQPAPAAQPAPDPRRSFRARRVALLHLRLTEAAPWTLPFLTVAALLGAPIRAFVRLVTKEPGLAGDEIRAAAAVLLRPGAVARARRRTRAIQRVPARQLRPLRADWRAVWRVGHDRRLHAAAQRRQRRTMSDVEIAERAAMTRRRRATGGMLAVALTTIAALAFGPLLVGGPLTGGALLPLGVRFGDLWHTALSAWIASGDGQVGPADPLLGVLAVLSLATGGSGQTVVTVLVLASIPLAGAGAWYASGAATRSPALRAWATAVWTLTPALLLATGQGRLGAVVAHTVLPWAALGVARALGVERRDVIESLDAEPARKGASAGGSRPASGSPGAGAAAGLALAIAAAGAPVLLVAGLLAVLLVAFVARGRRRNLLLVAIPPLALLAPIVLAGVRDVAAGSWRVLLADPGVPLASDAGAAYGPLLGWPVTPAGWPLLPVPAADVAPLVATGVLAAAALIAFVRARRFRAVLAGWLVAVAGLAAALGASRVDVAVGQGIGEDSLYQVVRGWAGAGTSLVVLGLLVAVVAAGDGLRGRLSDYPFGWRQIGTAVAATLLVLGPAASAGVWGWQMAQARATEGPDSVLALEARSTDPVPAIGLEVQRPPARSSVMSLAPEGPGVTVRLWRADGDRYDEQSVVAAARALTGPPGSTEVVAPDAAATDLAGLAAGLAAGSAGDPRGDLAAHAVGVVVVPPGEGEAREDLVARLDATAGLERVTENASGTVWRVAPPEGASATGRIDVVAADGMPLQVVPAQPVGGQGGVDAGDPGRALVLAERADVSWQARLDGRVLPALEADWRQTFDLGEAGGTVVVTSSDGTLSLIHAVQALVLGMFALLALPLRRRRAGVA